MHMKKVTTCAKRRIYDAPEIALILAETSAALAQSPGGTSLPVFYEEETDW